MKINSIKRQPYTGQVFNIGVPANHTYFAEGTLVHNCYKGSTIHGRHAKRDDVIGLIHALAEQRVFEIAFGGGEPTLHPDFADMLLACKSAGIVPNFTTRNPNWYYNPKLLKAAQDCGGGIAFSCSNAREVQEALSRALTFGFDPQRLNVHIVMGTVWESDLKAMLEIIRSFNAHAVLLGYKAVERGEKYKPTPYPWWMKVVQESRYSVNIDTALAQEYHEQLQAEGVPSWMYHVKEGTWSMYIDAVSMKAGASSYAGELVPLNPDNDSWHYGRYVSPKFSEQLSKIFNSF